MIRVAIVEDEDVAAEALSACLARFGEESGEDFRVTHYADPVALLDRYAGFDLIFMDIKMPNMDGMEGARRLRERDSRVKLVFVTSMAQYAAKGYEVEALDFIVKPVVYSDFSFKMKRALRSISRSGREQMVISHSSGLIRVYVDEVAYVEVRGHDLTYHLADRTIQVRGTMKQAEEALSPHGFLRCNNCYIVNPRHIDWVDGYTLKTGGDELQISHPRRKQFLEQLSRWYAGGGM